MDQAGTLEGAGPGIQPGAVTIAIALYITLSVFFTLSRLVTRACVHRELWWDDRKYISAGFLFRSQSELF